MVEAHLSDCKSDQRCVIGTRAGTSADCHTYNGLDEHGGRLISKLMTQKRVLYCTTCHSNEAIGVLTSVIEHRFVPE